jgi:hypothetical protein
MNDNTGIYNRGEKMRKIFLTILLCLCAMPLWANETDTLKEMTAISTPAEFRVFSQFYYTNPRPDLVSGFIRFIVTNKLNEDKSYHKHVIPFLGEIFKANDDKIAEWFQPVGELSNSDVYVLCAALHWSSMTNAKKQFLVLMKKATDPKLGEYLADLMEKYCVEDMRTVVVTSPEQMDMIWNCFFATGDVAYARRIIRLCDEDRSNLGAIMIYSAARFSAGALANTHSVVMKVCQEEYEQGNDARKAGLAHIVRK